MSKARRPAAIRLPDAPRRASRIPLPVGLLTPVPTFGPCYAAPSLVESRKGAVAWAALGIAPFPFAARQTGRADIPHPAFRLASSQGTRRRAEMDPAQPRHAELPEHGPIGEPRDAARRDLVTPDQKMPHALIDVVVDRSIGRSRTPGAMGARGLGCRAASCPRTFGLSRATLVLDGLAPRYAPYTWPRGGLGTIARRVGGAAGGLRQARQGNSIPGARRGTALRAAVTGRRSLCVGLMGSRVGLEGRMMPAARRRLRYEPVASSAGGGASESGASGSSALLTSTFSALAAARAAFLAAFALSRSMRSNL